MNSKVLNYINLCEKWKVQIKEIHWRAKNLSQHELCDDIASAISDFEDLVSEVEQSISGNIKKGELKPDKANEIDIKPFVENVISESQKFLKELEGMGDKYIGVKSECETFIGAMQRNLYLVNFTMKEDLKRRLANRINEAYRKEENIKTTFHGTKPSTEKGLFKRINDLTKNGQLNTRLFGGVSDALDFYRRILGKIGNLRCIDACEGNNYVVKLDTEGGLSYLGLMRIKDAEEGQCKASITFSPHADVNDGVEPEESEPTIEDDFDYEDTPNEYGTVQDDKNYEIYGEGRITRMTGSELHNLIKESVKKLLENDYNYNPIDLDANSVRSRYADQIERDENYKENLKRFKVAFITVGREYPGRKPFKDFLKYVKEVEGDSLYEKIWEHYGGEYEELADQYLQNAVMSNKKMESKEPTGSIVEKSDIHIKSSKKGTFTAAATKHGESVQGFASKVLNNKENYSPAMVKKANFAKNFGGKK